MNQTRRISLPTHGLIELATGLALVIGSLALSLGALGTILTFVAGVLVAGLGVGAADSTSLRQHQSLDRMLATGLAIAAIAAALLGDPRAAVVLLAGAATQFALGAATRWTRAPLGA